MNYEYEIKKLEAQIKELEAEAEAYQKLPPVWEPYFAEDQIKQLKADQELPPVWVPDFGEVFYVAEEGSVYADAWTNDHIDRSYLRMGNLFKTKQQAEDYAKALELIETIRRERFKVQGNWWPSEYEARYTIYWDQRENCIDTVYISWLLSAPAFGNWQDQNVLMGVVEKYDSELGWYFVDYLPSIN